jgi:hypothetical protein
VATVLTSLNVVNPLQNDPLGTLSLRNASAAPTAAVVPTQLGPGIVGELLTGLERARLDLTFLDQILGSRTGASAAAPALAFSAEGSAPPVLTEVRRRLDHMLTQLVAHIGEAGRTERASCGGSCCGAGATSESTGAVGLRAGDTTTPAAAVVAPRSVPPGRTQSRKAAGVGAVVDSGTWGAG